MDNKDFERAVMFLALPKESQGKIIAEVNKVANLVCEFLKEATYLANKEQNQKMRY